MSDDKYAAPDHNRTGQGDCGGPVEPCTPFPTKPGPTFTGSTLFAIERDHWKQRALDAESKLSTLSTVLAEVTAKLEAANADQIATSLRLDSAEKRARHAEGRMSRVREELQARHHTDDSSIVSRLEMLLSVGPLLRSNADVETAESIVMTDVTSTCYICNRHGPGFLVCDRDDCPSKEFVVERQEIK